MFLSLKRVLLGLVLVAVSPVSLADTYRYMHVTIDTPWIIFLGLLVAVMVPFILMAVLYWHNAMRRNAEEDELESDKVKER